MSTDERPVSRAEARRRSRLTSRGELPATDDAEVVSEGPPQRSGNLLTRIFPPAPPLPNRPDPLAGYRGGGALRPITERLYLLRTNLLAWGPTGLLTFIGLFVSLRYQGDAIGLLGTFLLFGALIAAGWFGWQRPALYGTIAAILGYLVYTTLILVSFAMQEAGPDILASVIGSHLIQGVYYAGLGFIGGWYGGYLRRRQAQVAAQLGPRRRR